MRFASQRYTEREVERDTFRLDKEERKRERERARRPINQQISRRWASLAGNPAREACDVPRVPC